MTHRLRHDLTYHAPADAVHAMLHNAVFREAVCERQHVLRHTVSVDGDRVTIDQVHAARKIPSFAKRFVGDEINIVQTETWTTPTDADIDIQIPGKSSGTMKGTLRLVEVGEVTTEQIDLEINVGVPLVGGKVESLLSDLMLKALKRENEVGRVYLAGR